MEWRPTSDHNHLKKIHAGDLHAIVVSGCMCVSIYCELKQCLLQTIDRYIKNYPHLEILPLCQDIPLA